jgi:putative MFS transporter
MIGPSFVGLMLATGLSGVFLAFGAVAAVAAVITGACALETKGRVLEEVSP